MPGAAYSYEPWWIFYTETDPCQPVVNATVIRFLALMSHIQLALALACDVPGAIVQLREPGEVENTRISTDCTLSYRLAFVWHNKA